MSGKKSPSSSAQDIHRSYEMPADAYPLYYALLDNVCKERMMVLADRLEEEGTEHLLHLADTYRWASGSELMPLRFPCLLIPRKRTTSNLYFDPAYVYDWVSQDIGDSYERWCPSCCLIPEDLAKKIRYMEDKVYGSVHDAFVLLTRARCV